VSRHQKRGWARKNGWVAQRNAAEQTGLKILAEERNSFAVAMAMAKMTATAGYRIAAAHSRGLKNCWMNRGHWHSRKRIRLNANLLNIPNGCSPSYFLSWPMAGGQSDSRLQGWSQNLLARGPDQ
jgi:hypothetical protein